MPPTFPRPETAADEAAAPPGAGAEIALYLRTGAEVSFAVLHEAADPSDTAVVICPPFGWEEVASYRPRRAWAQDLAAAGHTTLRLSLPSTGDSAGDPHDPERLEAWTVAVAGSAAWLRQRTGARRIVAIGLGLGGMLAYRAAALHGGIDDLALWSVAPRGRTLVRQLMAFSRMESERFFEGLPAPPPGPEGELEVAGFTMSPETAGALRELDLRRLLPEIPSHHRVLLLERDGVAVDHAWGEQMRASGMTVEVAPGDGYAQMTSHPQTAAPAAGVLARILDWIAAAPAAVDAPAPAIDVVDAPRLEQGWTETPLAIPYGDTILRAILTEPGNATGGGLCAVLLNTGAVRRIGPNRMWVQCARRWAERGIPSLRIDVQGIGDADGPVVGFPQDALFHEPHLVAQLGTALDVLADAGTGSQFFLVGLCSGAYWAFRTCVTDSRVAGVALLNWRVIAWSDALAPERYVRRALTERPSLARIRRVVTPALLREVLRWVIRAPLRAVARLLHSREPEARGTDDPASLVNRLLHSGRQILILFSEREPLHDELRAAGHLSALEDLPNVTLTRLAVNDHTLRPRWAQERAQEAIDGALEATIDATRPSISAGPRSA